MSGKEKKELSFEEALANLESIIDSMEKGEGPRVDVKAYKGILDIIKKQSEAVSNPLHSEIDVD